MLRAALLVAITLSATPAQAAAWRPAKSVLVPVPSPSPADNDALRSASRSWNLGFRGEALYVSPTFTDEPRVPALPFRPNVNTTHLGYYGTQPASVLHIRNTWLLSYNRGEFGGGLWQFSEDGRNGQRLLDDPAYALQPYGDGAIVVTGVASPFFRNSLRIHFLALRNGVWSESAHDDFKNIIAPLVHVGRRLFGIVHFENGACALAETSMSASLTLLWRTEHCPPVTTIARSAGGEFALGAANYVIRLHARGASVDATWYAPVDCIGYAGARCIAAPGRQPFSRRVVRPGRLQAVSPDGTWMLLRSQQLLHFTNAWKAEAVPLPPVTGTQYFRAISTYAGDVLLDASDALWLRRSGQWKTIAMQDGECAWFALQAHGAWCLAGDRGAIKRIGFDGASMKMTTFRKAPAFVTAGSLDDIWFADDSESSLGHISSSGSVEAYALKAPVTALSRSQDATWFTEADGRDYGFVDAGNGVHETIGGQYTTVKSVVGARRGAWVKETYGDSFIVRHNSAGPPIESRGYLAGVRRFVVTVDGTLWSLSSEYPTIERLTEDGRMSRYTLPCADQHLQLAAAPDNGVWFLSSDPGCSGVIDGKGVHVRDLPSVETVVYR